MSGEWSSVHYETATNDFVNDLKSLSLFQKSNEYADTIERLLIYLKQATPYGLLKNKPFAFAIIDNLHRIISIFDKKLLDENENSQLTNLFLNSISDLYQDVNLYELFLAIKDLTRIEIIFHNYLPLLKQNYFTNDDTYDSLITCILPIIGCSSAFVLINENNLPSNLLSYLLVFAKNNWHNKQRQNVIISILMLIKILCKKPMLVSMIIRSEWPNACIQWLEVSGPRPSIKTDCLLAHILLKLARHAVAVEYLNQLNCIQALNASKEQMKKDYTEEEYATIDFIQSIIYALLVEADEIKRNFVFADKLMCNILKQLVSYTIQASKNELFIHKGCHISEFLCVLCKLFVNDDIVNKCLNESSQLFDCLTQLLIQFTMTNNDITRCQQALNDEALVSLANLLWSISFHESYHEKFRSNKALMNTISNLATSSLLYTNTHNRSCPRDICSLKKATEGILWNLKSLYITQQKHISEEKPMIMISYSHSDSIFCKEVVEHLSQYITVWIDYKQVTQNNAHSDDLWEEIAGAMEMASIIILIVSKEYYDSKSCRQELSYATDTLKKRIVPIYAPDQQFKASGWLGIRIAGQKYVHFGRKHFTDAFNELLSLVTVDQKSIAIPASTSSQKPIVAKTSKIDTSLKSWTSKDIRKWFEDNHIHKDLITLFADQFYTGTALIVYAHHLKRFYRNEYSEISTNYSRTFHGKRLQTIDFITFADAFWRLREEHDPQSKIDDTCEKYTTNQLSCPMKVLKEGTAWLCQRTAATVMKEKIILNLSISSRVTGRNNHFMHYDRLKQTPNSRQDNLAEQVSNTTQYKTVQQTQEPKIKSEPTDYIQKARYDCNPH
ncbi:unnamed protein product [Adineta steineri]|uniref:TIR domain-containing protein n=1 Tax=Adineta steineri TaxID=433720 RepID=A0A815V5L5_9BILA|nr:unnamed protein product [Adineta steineri]CAF1530251.1 unnamed protein product [Adineta steineri]